MATRTYCDLCGNTVRDPAVYVFGCRHPANHKAQQAAQQQYQQYQMVQAQQGILAGNITSGYAASVPTYLGTASAGSASSPTPLTEVDLCPTCEKIWIEKVANITRHTDVKPA